MEGPLYKMINRIAGARFTAALLAVSLSAFTLTACGGRASGGGGNGGDVRINGAGATFPYPLYQKWFSEYNKANAGVRFDYQSIGSGGGIKQVTSQTVDFGGTDAPMKDEDLKSAPGEIIHIPTVLGAVVVTYNLPGVASGLKLTPEAIAGIYLGNIKKWNDPALAEANEGVSLPAVDITVVQRSDGSGTTFVFTDFLSKVSQDWKSRVGAGTAVNFPVGVGAKGNEGVTGQVKQTPNSIGYTELIYAEENKLPYASVKNAAGSFVRPSLDTVTAAAASVANQMPDDLRVSITNPPGADAYPIASFTYILVYKEQKDRAKGKALVDFLWWAIHDGEQMAREKLYAPLPKEVVEKAEQKLKTITHQGTPLRAS